MDGTAIKAMMAEIAPVIRDYVAEEMVREVEPLRAENIALIARIASLEERQLEKGEKGDAGEPGEAGQDAIGIADGAIDPKTGHLIIQLTDGSEKDFGRVVGKDGTDGIDGKDGSDGSDGRDGKDGRGIKTLLIDRTGALVATMDDGDVKNLGPVVGKDGADGLPGEPGQDGFSLDDFDCEPVDERTIALKFQRGDVVHKFELEFPVIIDRGVFKEGESYVRGDAVTWGGSLWIAQKATAAKPDTADSGWRLSVKKGRDGKDAK